jgi:hypothetical protein
MPWKSVNHGKVKISGKMADWMGIIQGCYEEDCEINSIGFGHYVLKLIHLVGEQAVCKWERQTQGSPKITMYKSLFDREAKPPKYKVLDAIDFLAEKVGPREADYFIDVARKELAQSVQRQDH